MSQMEYTVYEDEDEGTFRTYYGDHVTAVVLELDDDCGYVERIDVDEGYRGRGIGTAAIADIKQDFWKLYFAPDNENAARLYARIGEPVEGVWVGNLDISYLDQGYGVYEVW